MDASRGQSRKARNLSSAAASKPRPQSKQGPSARRATSATGNRLVRLWRDWTSRPLFDYYGLMTAVALLTGTGLVMVLSASMASSGTESGSVWAVFSRQLVMVVGGVIAMWIVMKLRIETIRSLSWPALGIAGILLILVIIPGIGIGLEETGARSWLSIGGISMQPSELAKIALALWGSRLLADKVRSAVSTMDLFGAFGLVSLGVLTLVMLQRDLGMVASMAFVVLALAWFSGLPRKFIAIIAGGGFVALALGIAFAGFRSARIRIYMDTLFGRFNDIKGDGYQSYQGFLSLADGSMTGVGLGQSSAKWFYLPEAKNDFIFAIIGEEGGFMLAVVVIALYAFLGWVGLRIAGKHRDPFLRLLSGTLTTATVVQAFINIGYVVGVLPVTGLQLPLISAGGTSALVTLLSMGLLATCARHEPEAVSAMQTEGRPLLDRVFGLPEPISYDEKRRNAPKIRSHRDPQRFGPPVTAGASRSAWRAANVRSAGRSADYDYADYPARRGGRGGNSRADREPQRPQRRGSRTHPPARGRGAGGSQWQPSPRGRERDFGRGRRAQDSEYPDRGIDRGYRGSEFRGNDRDRRSF